ncbi:MAG TPA: polymer-forming cytoskeletal protein [Steroidobacteraceae bacterium]|jgi:cytoskeletal protein CcmA (bactofilin family)|nr:polymer-forming cytoskeletal protein [Steroidobacteraceae bacterium]
MPAFGIEPRQEREAPRQPTAPSVQSPPAMQSVPSTAPKIAVLGPTLHFKGELSAEEDFILQGKIEGSIANPQNVTIGNDGTVIGDIRARTITIDGKVEGDLYGDEAVIVHQSGKVTGNIFAPRVGLVEGAFFKGRIEMSDKPPARSSAPAPATAQSNSRQNIPTELTPGVPLSPEATERVLSRGG